MILDLLEYSCRVQVTQNKFFPFFFSFLLLQDLIIEIEFVKLTCSQIQFEYCSWELNLLQNSGFVEVNLFCLFGLFECVLLRTWRVTFFVNTVNISVNFFPWFLECIVVASENLVSMLLRHFSPFK